MPKKKKKKTKNENDFTIALLCNIIIRKLNFTHIFHFLSKAENKSSSLSLSLSQSLSLSLSLSLIHSPFSLTQPCILVLFPKNMPIFFETHEVLPRFLSIRQASDCFLNFLIDFLN